MSRRRTLILASASPARLRLLRDAGIEPTVTVSGVDESAVPTEDPEAMVLELARLKAEAVAVGQPAPATLVLGADSTLVLDGAALGKPGTAEAATARWQQMRGRAGTLLTGHHLIDADTGKSASGLGSTTVHFADASDEEIAAYVASGEPLEVAGAFTLDGRAAPFIDRIEGDPSNVIGLSLPVVRRLLAELGVGIVTLWQ
ncbi:MAG TPA: nucleoside triphosphate pyrophosphatase [Mycobacteriales bacterium]|nr:nucleoside triphosphate pyrophosphatase [Mycobacteriales bacterium]